MKTAHLFLVTTILTSLPGAAFAQVTAAPTPVQDGAASTGTDTGDIIVTAQKTSEKLSKAPVAISVLSQDTLTRQGIDSAASLVTTVPNLQLSQNGFAIRGVGSNNGFSGYSTVATQIDGIYDPSARSLNLGLFDVGSVEVLRGPQGTVYGRNATAGVVNINTADPGRRYGSTADVQFGSFNGVRARAAVDLPVSDSFRLRVSAFRDVDQGYGPQLAAPDKYNKTDLAGIRVTSVLKIGSTLTWRLSLNYGENKGTVPLTYLRSSNYYPQGSIANGTFGPLTTIYAQSVNPGLAQVTDNRMDITSYAVRSRLTWQATDALSLTYLAGYSVLKDNGVDSATGVFTEQSINRRTDTQSHEVDVNFTKGILNLVLGGYLYQDKQPSGVRLLHAGDTAPAPFNSVVNAAGIAKVAGTGTNISTLSGVDVVDTYYGAGTKSQAIFGQGTVEILPGLKVLGGLRSTWEQTNQRQIELVCPGDTITLANISTKSCPTIPFVYALTDDSQRAEAKFSNISWKAGVNYELTRNTLLYVNVGTGFRGGGLEASSNAAQYQQYQPETVTNYEAGVRSSLIGGKLYLALTAFNMDYKNLQVSSIVLNPTTKQVSAVTTNAATARLRGVEFEATIKPTSHDRISGYVSYLDAKIRSFPKAPDNLNSGSGNYNALVANPLPTNVILDASGNSLPNAPKWSGRISYAHIFDLPGWGKLTPSVDFYAQSATYSDVQNYSQSRRDAYTKTDLNLRYDLEGGQISITGFVNNVENSQVPNTLTTVWSSTTVNYDPPRTYGVRLGTAF